MIDLAKRVNVLTGMLERIDDKSRRSLVVAEIAVCDRILAAGAGRRGRANRRLD